ncbi:MAG: FAD binding domain-containing protein [Chloroflexota bacterium]
MRDAEPLTLSPTRLADAYAVLADEPLRPIAGGTDLMVGLAAGSVEPPARMLDLWGLDELRGIRIDGDDLVLGALTTWAEVRRSALVGERLPALAAAAATIGAVQIQARGTIGGNAVNASPAGDSLPVLLAADVILEAGGPRGERSIAAAAFWPAYRRTALASDELLLRVRFPALAGRQVRYRKVGTRRAQAISKVVLAVGWRPDAAGAWHDVRVAYGSMAATPVRVSGVEAALEGAVPGPAVVERAVAAVHAGLHPIDDVRSTADYRLAVAGRILARLLRDEGGW